MKNKIEIPDELAHLIEKREQSDRRAASDKETQGTADKDAKPAAAKKSNERRTGGDRRSK